MAQSRDRKYSKFRRSQPPTALISTMGTCLQAASVTVPGSGKSATSIAPKFKDTVLREYCEYVRTVKDCTDLAQARLDSIAMGFVSGSGSCVGLPEIIPGRFISITGMDGETDGTYYISHVRHTISEDDGYRTQIEIKGAKA